jgi:two-component system OmpR family response regulator
LPSAQAVDPASLSSPASRPSLFRRLASEQFDLLVLDRMLPDGDGTELGRDLRTRGYRIPILFLSARDAVADTVEALGAGGDDYLTKPFSLEELVARVQALLRRADAAGDDVLSAGGLLLRERRRTVLHGSEPIALSDAEFAILRCFLLRPGEAISNAQILHAVWLDDFDGSRSVVDTYVASLRRKLAAAGSEALVRAGPSSYRLDAV